MKMYCEINQECFGPIDRHHITTRGAGGKDTPENLVLLCRRHHIEVHSYGWGKMIDKYPQALKILLKRDRQDIISRIRRVL